MTVTGKIRIYDLARDRVPEELDEKAKKKIQAELTRQILKYANDLGQNVKTASSSIDSGAVATILSQIDMEEIISEATGEAKPSVSSGIKVIRRPTVSSQPAEKEEDSKPKLKIVRRITKVEQEEQLQKEEDEKSKQENPELTSQEANQEEGSIDQEVEEPITENPLKENLQEMMRSKKPSFSKDKVKMGDLSNVRSIPLKPVSAPFVQPVDPNSAGQPYRVAKPTISSQGIGRKRKKGGPQEDRPRPVRVEVQQEQDSGPKEITITKPMTVRELAQTISVPETQIITYFFMKKIIKTVNDILEKDLIVEYLKTLNYIVHTKATEEEHVELKSTLKQDEESGNLVPRPPVVTIMGHVDHGKTTLVDTIRKTKSKVVDQESGGITQHISTYRIEAEDFDGNVRKITILDTPGHEAFAAMRKRGANVTDLVVLIVAADDGVKPQTLECIKHIKDNHIPFLVAVNKIDKPGANVDKVLGQLAEYDIITQNYGGTVECAQISALQNKNIDDLLMKIFLVADAELA